MADYEYSDEETEASDFTGSDFEEFDEYEEEMGKGKEKLKSYLHKNEVTSTATTTTSTQSSSADSQTEKDDTDRVSSLDTEISPQASGEFTKKRGLAHSMGDGIFN